jgi:hypothetical protein
MGVIFGFPASARKRQSVLRRPPGGSPDRAASRRSDFRTTPTGIRRGRRKISRKSNNRKAWAFRLREAGEGIRTLDIHLGKVTLYH